MSDYKEVDTYVENTHDEDETLLEEVNNFNDNIDKNKTLIESDEKDEINEEIENNSLENSKKLDKEKDSVSNFEKVLETILKEYGYKLKSELTNISKENKKYYLIEKNDKTYFLKIQTFIPNIRDMERIFQTINEFPNKFVTIYEYGEIDNFYFEVREYFPNGSIEENIDLVKNDIENFIFQINESLKTLHERFIVHLDLKPTNIIYNNGKYLITDFEIAGLVDPDTEIVGNDKKNGSKRYTAPEVLEVGYKTFSADYWSLGMILYRIFVGKVAFENDEDWNHFKIQKQEYIPILGTNLIPKRFWKLIAGLLVMDYKKRIGYNEVSKWLNKEDFDIKFKFDIPVFQFNGKELNSLDELIYEYCENYDKAIDHFNSELREQLDSLGLNEIVEQFDSIINNINYDLDDKLAIFMTKFNSNRFIIFKGVEIYFEQFYTLLEKVITTNIKNSEKEYDILRNIQRINGLFLKDLSELNPRSQIVLKIYNLYSSLFHRENWKQIHEILNNFRKKGFYDLLIKNYKYFSKVLDELLPITLSSNVNIGSFPKNKLIQKSGIYFLDSDQILSFTKNTEKKIIIVGTGKNKISCDEIRNVKYLYFLNVNFENSPLEVNNSKVFFINCNFISSKQTPIYSYNSNITFKSCNIEGKYQGIYAEDSTLRFFDNTLLKSKREGITIENSKIIGNFDFQGNGEKIFKLI